MRRFFDGDPFERSVALMIALVIIFVSIIGYLEWLASEQSDVLERNAQQLAIETMGIQARGEIELGYGYADAYRLVDNLALQAIAADNNGYVELADAYNAASTQIMTLTPLLQAPYFNIDTFELDLAAYEADLFYVDISLRREQFTNISSVADQWEQKSQNYIAQLTILTVTLFLFGISNTISGASRWIFVALGTVLTLATVILTVRTIQTEIESLSDDAILAYAQGDGMLMQERYGEAIDLFTQALDHTPDYAKAYAGRAQSHWLLDNLDEAIKDYRQAIDLGYDTSDVLSDLSYIYYIKGQFESAQELIQLRIAKTTSYTLDYFDSGLLYLVEGNPESAVQAYADGVELTEKQASQAKERGEAIATDLIFFLDLASNDLIALHDCLVYEACEGQPPVAELASNEAVIGTINSVIIWLKSNMVALENDRPLVDSVPDNALQTLILIDGDRDVETFSFYSGINDIRVVYEDIPLKEGQDVLVKVYYEGEEDVLLRTQFAYDGREKIHKIALDEESIYFLGSGYYEVEIYVDWMLVAREAFFIEDGPPPPTDTDSDSLELVDEDFGFTLRYPADWNLINEDIGLYFLEPPDPETTVLLIGYADMPDDLNEVITIFSDEFGFTPGEETTATTVDEQDALLFSYGIEGEDHLLIRALAVTYDGFALIIGIETTNPDIDLEGLLDEIRGGLILGS